MENWTKTKIEEIAKVNPSLTKKLSPNDAVTFLGMTDVSEDGKILRRQTKKLAAVKSGFTAFQDGDILVAKITPCFENGKGAFVNELENGVGFGSTEFHVLRANENILPKFLYFHTRDFSFRRLGAASMVGSAGQKRVQTNFIETYKIPLPPLAEQKKIAEILSTWDKSVETTEKLIAAKQKLKKSLMQRLLTGSQRFPEFHGQKWKEARLKDVFSEIRNINDGGDSHSVMTISARRGLISQEDKFNRVIAGDSLKKYTQLKRGDFAYNKGNSKTYEMGCIYQLESKETALVPFVYICFSPSEKVFSGFYKQWFLAHGLDKQLKKIITSGARGDGLLNVNPEDFFKLKIPVPTREEQKKIAAVLNSCDAETNVLQSKLGALRQQKRGLMQKLLTGRVRVKIDENENAAFEN